MNFRKKINKKGFFLIAEIGNNHYGNINIAKKMITAASKNGADAVKLQYINPEKFIHFSNKKKLNLLKKISLSKKEITQLYKFAKTKKIELFASIFDHHEISFFSKLQNFFKIASGDNDLSIYFKLMSKYKKPTLVSTGLVNHTELRLIYNLIRANWNKKFIKNNIAIMHCVSEYPCKKSNLNLKSIKNIPADFIKGYSDHTIGIDACLYAFLLGAQVIEKHFTLNKKDKRLRDNQLSADPNDLKNLVENLKSAKNSLGSERKKISYQEKMDLNSIRRSPATYNEIKKGERIKFQDLIFLRPRIKSKNKVLSKMKTNKKRFDYL